MGGSVLSPTLFLLFINDLLSLTQCSIHSYADDSTLHFSMSFPRRPTQQELHTSRQDAAERLTSDLSVISDWGKANLVLFNASKLNFFTCLIDTTFQTTIQSSSTTPSCLPLVHWTFLAFPLLKLLTGNLISLLLLNQLP